MAYTEQGASIGSGGGRTDEYNPAAQAAEQIFANCDTKGRGYLEFEDLGRACPQLSPQEVRFIFQKLDVNSDGRISRNEFLTGFETVLNVGEKSGYKNLVKRASSHSILSRPNSLDTNKMMGKPEIVYHFEPEASSLESIPCQDDVLALYDQLQQTGVPDVLQQFEKVMGNVFKEIREQKEQNERLQKIYETERENYSKRMTEVESELDQQVAEAEARARREERTRLEKEKETLREAMEAEMSELHLNVRRLQKLETAITEGSDKSAKMYEMKEKVMEMKRENLTLKSNLASKHTEMALIKASLAQMRHEYEEKCLDLASEKETLIAYISEQDNLTRQLQLLYDANTKLHDTNDSLRTTLESRHAFCRQYNLRSPSPGTNSPGSSISHSRQSSVASSTGRLMSPNAYSPSRVPRKPLRLATTQWATEETDDDSGLARGSDTASVGGGTDGEHTTPRLRNNDGDSEFSSLDEEIGLNSDTDPEQRSRSAAPLGDFPNGRHSSNSSAATVTGGGGKKIRNLLSKGRNREATGPPERTFRVVLAGDASVGKSSFILRLVKDQFSFNLQSTLGVDFHVKSLNVDGKNVAIQLWDTAGQERFRSLCKSYFRKADGAILVYDCTSEQSFVSVRNWIETIQESVPRKIPVLLCGNKVDLRIPATAEGKRCVAYEDGAKIAKAINAIFIETSAKDGTNVLEAAANMIREMLVNEDYEVQATGVVLKESPSKSRSCCNK